MSNLECSSLVRCAVVCCSFHITFVGLAAAAKPWHSELHEEDEERI